jgi:restriction endonuclease S subunit
VEILHYSRNKISSAELNPENYVGVDNLLQGKLGKQQSNFVPIDGNYAKYNEGDILIGNIRPYLKKIWFANNSGGASGDVLVLQLNESHAKDILPLFIMRLLMDDRFFNYAMQTANGTKMPRGDKRKILEYTVIIPPLRIQEKIVSKVKNLEQQISTEQSRLIELKREKGEILAKNL